MAGTDLLDINVRDTIKEVIVDFEHLPAQMETKAMVRAANTAARKVRTESGREIRKIYNLKLRAVRAATKLLRARRNQAIVRASVVYAGRPIPLIEFAARAVNPWNIPGRRHNRRGGGVSVRIKKASGRRTVKGAFIAQTARMSSPGVFQRVGKTREAIRQLRSVSIPTTVVNRAVYAALEKTGYTSFRKEFVRQLNLLLRKQT